MTEEKKRKKMASINPPVCNFGWLAPHFDLAATDGARHNLQQSMGKNGLLVMFICNHCPYVKAILPRLIHDVSELKMLGVNTVAIMSKPWQNGLHIRAMVANKHDEQAVFAHALL